MWRSKDDHRFFQKHIVYSHSHKSRTRSIWLSQTASVFSHRSRITYSFPSPQNHYLLQACFESYYRKIQSWISSPVNLTGPSFSRPVCVCVMTERERNSRAVRWASAWDRNSYKYICTNPYLVQQSHPKFTLLVKRAFLNFSQPSGQRRDSIAISVTTKVLFHVQHDSVCLDEKQRSLLEQVWRLGILAGLIKVARGALFFQALCDVWMWTQTSLHYVATALEPLVLGERPFHWQPSPAGGHRRLPLCYVSFFSLLPPLIPFSTLLLASNPAFPLSFLSRAILPPQSLYLSLADSYSSSTAASLISSSTHFYNHSPWRTAFKPALKPGSH